MYRHGRPGLNRLGMRDAFPWAWEPPRRGGTPPWNPLNLPNLWFWVDASQIVGLVDGNPVALWEDLSPNGFDVSQAVPGLQPTYRTGVVNGLPVVRFDGADLLSRLAVPAPGNSWTIFAVVMTNTTNVWKWVIRFTKDASEVNGGMITTDTGKISSIFTDGPWSWHNHLSTPAFTAGVFAICLAGYDFGNIQLVNLGAIDETVPQANVPSIGTRIDVGGNLWSPGEDWNGDIPEIVACNAAMLPADEALCKGYFTGKYGLPIT